VTLDGKEKLHLFGSAFSSDVVFAAIPGSGVLSQFKKAHFMVAEGKGATFQFKLDSINPVLATISNCVAKTKANGIASVGDFSLPVAAPVSQPKPSSSSSADPQKTFEQSGTGFVVSNSGQVVTSNHVIRDCVGDVHGNLIGESLTDLRVV
jgi:S1-C subfamily serine protease